MTLTSLNLDDTLQQVMNTIVDFIRLPLQALQNIISGWTASVNAYGVTGPIVAAFVIGVAVLILRAFSKMKRLLPPV